ncbi:hypothetical protein WAK64_04040 [Bacillus spongiae]|uniref:Uncharacterized protein n=1 Tax=Bacillus spongiae TaxID=2683610 RepID=A0ABU8HAB7_9BACI
MNSILLRGSNSFLDTLKALLGSLSEMSIFLESILAGCMLGVNRDELFRRDD